MITQYYGNPVIDFLDRATNYAADRSNSGMFNRLHEEGVKLGTFSVRSHSIDGIACVQLLAENAIARRTLDELAGLMLSKLPLAPTSPEGYVGLSDPSTKATYLISLNNEIYQRVV